MKEYEQLELDFPETRKERMLKRIRNMQRLAELRLKELTKEERAEIFGYRWYR